MGVACVSIRYRSTEMAVITTKKIVRHVHIFLVKSNKNIRVTRDSDLPDYIGKPLRSYWWEGEK